MCHLGGASVSVLCGSMMLIDLLAGGWSSSPVGICFASLNKALYNARTFDRCDILSGERRKDSTLEVKAGKNWM
jgi:hypothetical protein